MGVFGSLAAIVRVLEQIRDQGTAWKLLEDRVTDLGLRLATTPELADRLASLEADVRVLRLESAEVYEKTLALLKRTEKRQRDLARAQDAEPEPPAPNVDPITKLALERRQHVISKRPADAG